MKNIILILFIILIAGSAKAQVVGSLFPQLEGETVESQKIIIPDDTNGKFTLVGMAYSKRSEKDLKTWFQPVFSKFLQKSEGLFSDFTYDVNVYFIPMFTGIKAAGAGAAKKKALKKVDKSLHPNVLFYQGSLKDYKDALDFERKDIPYFFILNEEGEIIYATSGAFSKKKMAEIEGVLE